MQMAREAGERGALASADVTGAQRDLDTVTVRNTATQDCPRFGILGIASPLFAPQTGGDALPRNFAGVLAVRGVLATVPAYEGKWAVALEPIVDEAGEPLGWLHLEWEHHLVPPEGVRRNLTVRAYAFQIEILYQEEVLACHPRSYGRDQDVFDPLHYLPLLEQRLGAFEHARPLRQWRTTWPPAYEQLLARLQTQDSDGQAIREFVRILRLHERYPAARIEAAVEQALRYGCIHADGVELCLRQALHPETPPPLSDLPDHPKLAHLTTQHEVPDVGCYDQLLQDR